MNKLEPDEFQAWKEHRITERVLRVLRLAADQLRADQSQALLGQYLSSPEAWASLQVNTARVAGFCEATDQFVSMTLDAIQDEDEVKTE